MAWILEAKDVAKTPKYCLPVVASFAPGVVINITSENHMTIHLVLIL